MFSLLLDQVRGEVTRILMNVKVQTPEQVSAAAQQLEAAAENFSNVTYTAPNETGEAETVADRGLLGGRATPAGALPRVGRNDPCPCGSGKKYKHCHGKLA